MSVATHEVRIDSLRAERPNLRLIFSPTALESWIAEIIEDIIAIWHLDSQSAFEGATLAALWLEDYLETKDSFQSMEWSGQFRAMILVCGRNPKGAMQASFERVSRELHSDAIRLAAMYAFCEGLDDQTADVWRLLTIEEA